MPHPDPGRAFASSWGNGTSVRVVLRVENEVVIFARTSRSRAKQQVLATTVLSGGTRHEVVRCSYSRWLRWAKTSKKLSKAESYVRGVEITQDTMWASAEG